MPAPKQVSPLDAHIGYWLRFVSNHVSHAFQVKVEQHGVTVAEWVILRALYEEDGIQPSVLADKIGLTRGAVSKLVDRAVRKGLVVTSAVAADRRAQVVALTTAGRQLVPTLAAVADHNDAEAFGHLSTEERALLLAVLKRSVEQLEIKAVPVD